MTTSLKRLHGVVQFGGLLALIVASVLLFTGGVITALVSNHSETRAVSVR